MPTAPRRARTPLTVLLLVGTVLTFLLGGSGPASAHASVTRSEPADTSVLKTAPSQVTLAFTESVSLSDGSRSTRSFFGDSTRREPPSGPAPGRFV
ncbi:copper resistance protein CopC [Streptomyces sp. NPDC007095]|uniref:copper resistance CopC family protein n=1 Tax=Streptomyces sp. NPDC007095 TaxID=3154482 RepID=UPI0033E267DF